MSDALATNKALYADLWRHFALFAHDGWHAWREIAPFLETDKRRGVEIGPGKFPHLPPSRGVFVDLSRVALKALKEAGGQCVVGALPLPLASASFKVACAFELLEHVAADAALLEEIARVLEPGGVLFISCPMNPAYWTYYDGVMGHVRRYRADELRERLREAGFVIERGCARHDRMDRWFGWLFGIGVRYFTRVTAKVVEHYLPRVAALPHEWKDGEEFLSEAEKMGGVTLRARKVG